MRQMVKDGRVPHMALPARCSGSMVVWMVINFLLPFVVGGVAWQAHVGGFVVGGALAWLLVAGIPAWRGKSLAWRMRVYGGTMTVLVIALIALCNLANPYSALF